MSKLDPLTYHLRDNHRSASICLLEADAALTEGERYNHLVACLFHLLDNVTLVAGAERVAELEDAREAEAATGLV
jgi:hypothetical protein